ncbi:Uncharacterised protein [Klebsiella variicola]|nr:Uncharacterised protein [Klebsiella variicola]
MPPQSPHQQAMFKYHILPCSRIQIAYTSFCFCITSIITGI